MMTTLLLRHVLFLLCLLTSPQSFATLCDDTDEPDSAQKFIEAVKQNDFKTVNSLLSDSSMEVEKIVEEMTALSIAVENNRPYIATRLLKNIKGKTAISKYLTIAATKGRWAMVRLLANAGADVNTFIPDHDLPLVSATKANRADMVKFLLEKGADPKPVRSKDSPWKIAYRNRFVAVITELLKIKDEFSNLNEILRSHSPHSRAIAFNNHQTEMVDIMDNGKRSPPPKPSRYIPLNKKIIMMVREKIDIHEFTHSGPERKRNHSESISLIHPHTSNFISHTAGKVKH